MTESARPRSACSELGSGDLGLKTHLRESSDGSQGSVSFLPIVGWVTLNESFDGTAETETWSWEPVVVFEHELRPARTVADDGGTVALGLVKSRFLTARDRRRSLDPI